MKSPERITELLHLLSEASKSNYNAILNNFNFSNVDFSPFESWSDIKYTRNCLYKDEQFELILLCWEPDQETSIHGHEGEDCWVYMIEGEIEEIYYALDSENYLVETRKHLIRPDQQTFMNDKLGFHKLKNSNNGRSMSLHLYAKPIERCSFYDEQSSQFVRKSLCFDTVSDLLMVPR